MVWYGILYLSHGNTLAPTTLSWFSRRACFVPVPVSVPDLNPIPGRNPGLGPGPNPYLGFESGSSTSSGSRISPVRALILVWVLGPGSGPEARFSKASETFWARRPFFLVHLYLKTKRRKRLKLLA